MLELLAQARGSGRARAVSGLVQCRARAVTTVGRRPSWMQARSSSSLHLQALGSSISLPPTEPSRRTWLG